MQSKTTSTTSLPVYDYQLVIRPPRTVCKRLNATRSHILRTMLPVSDCKVGNTLIPVACFSQYAQNESKLTVLLHNMASSLAPVSFRVQHYGTTLLHHIYFNLLPTHGFSYLLRQLQSEKLSLSTDHKEPRFASFANISVAYKLNPDELSLAWQQLKHKKITLQFVAKNVLLLRKQPSETKWKILVSLPFQNSPAPIQQGLLFA